MAQCTCMSAPGEIKVLSPRRSLIIHVTNQMPDEAALYHFSQQQNMTVLPGHMDRKQWGQSSLQRKQGLANVNLIIFYHHNSFFGLGCGVILAVDSFKFTMGAKLKEYNSTLWPCMAIWLYLACSISISHCLVRFKVVSRPTMQMADQWKSGMAGIPAAKMFYKCWYTLYIYTAIKWCWMIPKRFLNGLDGASSWMNISILRLDLWDLWDWLRALVSHRSN